MALKKNKNEFEQVKIVGVGASAGGLEALREFVSHLSLDSHKIFVIAQHLAPKYRSMMVELLQRETRLKVKEAGEGILKENTIYIIPPNNDAIFENGKLTLLPPENRIGPKPSIDRLFASLGEIFETKAAAVILSGTGADGAKGLLAIKKNGGKTFAQTPETAKYSGMPTAAIETDAVDDVLNPTQIAQRICNTHIKAKTNPKIEKNLDPVSEILALVKLKTGNDFSGYKTASLYRRLTRQMNLMGYSDPLNYLDHLKKDSKEVPILAENLSVSVTDFFRDKEVFSELERLITQIIKGKRNENIVRIWVPGCATGQEA